ncbi:MAG: sulfite exporter TauE/SafE family protein [Solirubrobacteraceae bacterium]
MSAWHIIMILVAGIAAGTINTVVGSGTLITFPTLLAFGYAPVTANVSNTIGLVPGSVSGALGYRRELDGQRERLVSLGVAVVLGGVLGSILLLVLPAAAFKTIVPFFIALALVLILSQRQINRLLGGRRRGHGQGVGPLALAGAFTCGVYGGYFGAAQGILMLSVLGLSIDDSLQRLNAVKVVTTGLTNLVAGIVFVLAAHVAWAPAGLIAGGSVLGGVLGSRFGRRLPPPVLRALIVIVGVVAIIRLV